MKLAEAHRETAVSMVCPLLDAVADSALLPDLLHGEETRVWGDQAYRGQGEVIRVGAIATRIVLTKWSGRRTEPSRRCA